MSRALAAIVALAAALRAWLLARPLAALDGRALPDDAYLALQIARSIGTGDGPRFVDHFTNGFQPLFVWLAAIPFAWSDPGAFATAGQLDAKVTAALAIGCAFDVASVALLAAAVRRGSGSAAAGLLAGLIWAVHPAVLRVAVNGLETSTAIFFLLCVWNLTLGRPFGATSARRLFGIGVVVGVGALARVDLLLLGAYFAAGSLRALRAGGWRIERAWLGRNAALAAGTALGWAPWVIYSWHYTRAVLPGSGRAVRWISLTHAGHRVDAALLARMIGDGFAALGENLPWLGPAAVAVAALALARREARARAGWLALPAVFGAALFALYTGYVFAPWFFPRYLAPLNALAIACVAAGLGASLRRATQRAVWPGALVALALVGLCVAQPRFRALMFAPPDDWGGYRNLGLWARGAFRPGTVVGATQSGALAYYANGYRTVNLDGVVDGDAYAAVSSGRALEHLRERGVDYVVAWRRNYDYLRLNSNGFRESDLPLAGYIDAFRSWGIQWQIYRVHYPSGRTPPPLAGAARGSP